MKRFALSMAAFLAVAVCFAGWPLVAEMIAQEPAVEAPDIPPAPAVAKPSNVIECLDRVAIVNGGDHDGRLKPLGVQGYATDGKTLYVSVPAVGAFPEGATLIEAKVRGDCSVNSSFGIERPEELVNDEIDEAIEAVLVTWTKARHKGGFSDGVAASNVWQRTYGYEVILRDLPGGPSEIGRVSAR